MAQAKTERGPAGDAKTSPSKARDVDAFLRKVVKQFARAESAESTNRMAAVEDLKFVKGDQWPEAIRASRTIEKRPCLTINKTAGFCHQVENEQRQNRPSINISPVGDRGDPETAKMYRGLIRSIERACHADNAYDTGYSSSVRGGWGYWRIRTDYEEPDSFDQTIIIDRIRNPFRVYLDPDHQSPTGSDAKWGFITDLIPRSEFEAQFPKAAILAWEEGGMGDEYKAWSTTTHIRIAEYFHIEHDERVLVALENGHVGWEDELDGTLKRAKRTKTREVRVPKVKWKKLTAADILEDTDWLGIYIPIVKVIGDEIDIEGKVTYKGLVRDAKDPQRMYNFWTTSETELIALAPKAPWIMEEGQIEGHEQRWKEANNKSYPYLLYKGTSVSGKPSPPPQRQQFAGPPAGVVQAKISAAQDMQAVTGVRFDATLQERNYDESGKALRELKKIGDIGNYHYIDNLSRSLMHTGEILLDLIPKVFDTRRVLTILREDDTEERVEIDPTQGTAFRKEDGPDGRVRKIFNPKVGKYAVTVTTGPSFATKRAEAADSMLGFMKAVPQSAPIIGDLIAKNMDWPGADEIASRLQSMLPPHLLNKKLDTLPPEAKGLVISMSQQMDALKKERDQAVMMLGDKDKDRAIDQDKINKDFEAKVMKIISDFETKMAAKGDPAAELELKWAEMMGKLEIKLAEMHGKLQIQQEQSQLKAAESMTKMDQAGQMTDAKIAQGDKMTDAKIKQGEAAMKAKAKQKPNGGKRAT